jgi:hypothetical protein
MTTAAAAAAAAARSCLPPPWRASAVESDDDDDDNDYVGEILACPKRVPSGLAVRPLSSSPSLPLFCLCVPMCLF